MTADTHIVSECTKSKRMIVVTKGLQMEQTEELIVVSRMIKRDTVSLICN